MKVIHVSDLHGEIRLYQDLHVLAGSSMAEVITLGGDLLPSFPVTKRYEELIPRQKAFIDKFLRPYFRSLTETTLVKLILLIPGNWDLAYGYLFVKSIERVVDLDRKSYRLQNGTEVTGYPFVPPSPFRPKDFEKMDDLEASWPAQKNPSYVRSSLCDDELVAIDPHRYLRERGTIREDLDCLGRPTDIRRTIYLMHSPPHGTKLDVIREGNHVGSRSITIFIRQKQPFLTLHGHIHESPELSGAYWDRIGETVSINPGQGIGPGSRSTRLHATLFDLDDIRETLVHSCFGKAQWHDG